MKKMNLGDSELELIDPTPSIHSLFIHFDKLFFWSKLASRAVVRWSKRMYSCAGICSYEGRGGLCDIAVSEPLLKLRPRKDLIETLLHEMIHAYLFVVNRDQDRDGHGPNFKAHMHRINTLAGLNISIYHDFHDEVKLYQTHWWRCNGPCQTRRPHFGIVRRPVNKTPGPTDYWYKSHQKTCGGTFIKIKEPPKKGKKNAVTKPTADITKYINTNKTNNNVPNNIHVLKDSNQNIVKTNTKSNNSNAKVVTVKNLGTNTPQAVVFSGKGLTINGGRSRSNSVGVVETVRNVWANKQLHGTLSTSKTAKHKEPTRIGAVTGNNMLNTNKHKAKSVHIDSPPMKVMKIDDYFKNAATVLKDIYGEDFNVTQSKVDKKLVATVTPKTELVNCPVCCDKVSSSEINRHLDECLNKDILDNHLNEAKEKNQPTSQSKDNKLRDIVGTLPPVPAFKGRTDNVDTIKNKPSLSTFNPNYVNKVQTIAKNINYDKHVRKSDNFIVVKDEKPDRGDFGNLPSFLDLGVKIETPPIKIEPGTSKDITSKTKAQICACCGKNMDKPIEEHLDECLAFFDNNTTIAAEGASTSFANETIVIDDDDDDLFDETLTLNATGTKWPCPCCLNMVEEIDMNKHLDNCLR